MPFILTSADPDIGWSLKHQNIFWKKAHPTLYDIDCCLTESDGYLIFVDYFMIVLHGNDGLSSS